MECIRVLIVGSVGLAQEAHLACRRCTAITVHGPAVGASDVMAAVEVSVPDVVLVDIDVPNGVQTMAVIAAADPRLRLLAASTSTDLELAGRALSAGAAGVVLRGGPPSAFVDALRRCAAGELVLADVHLQALVATIHDRRGVGGDKAPFDRLTVREREILGLLAEGLGTIEVAATLGLSTATVRAHVKSILGKLGVHSTIDAVRLAWRAGIGSPSSIAVGA